MDGLFIPYGFSLTLQELGFDEVCLTYYNHNGRIDMSDDWCCGATMEDKRERNKCLAPTWEQAFTFFEEKYKLYNSITVNLLELSHETNLVIFYGYEIKEDIGNKTQTVSEDLFQNNKKTAKIELLKELIKLAKNKVVEFNK